MSATKTVTAPQVAQHKTRDDLWFIIDGKVYDVTRFLDEHPGGEEVLLEYAGMDASEAFDDVGHSEDARSMLAKYLVGDLDKNSGAVKSSASVARKSGNGNSAAEGNESWSMVIRLAVPLALLAAIVVYKLL